MANDYILIVDDQPESVDLLQVLLGSYLPDMETDSAADGETALAKIAARPPTLLLLDVKMPGIDGFEVCRRVKSGAGTSDIPVLMISGVMVGSKHRIRGLDLGADGYICKPFEPPEMIAQIKSLLRLKQSREALHAHRRDLEAELDRRTGALRRSEERYRTLVEQLPAITYIMELGPEKRTVFISPQTYTLLGFEAVEWMEDPGLWQTQIHPEDRDVILAQMALRDQGGEPFSIEYRMLTRDGAVVWFRNDGTYLCDAAGAPSAIHGVMMDITDRKRAEQALRESEEQLQHAQKMEALGRLSGGVAHDFNNLLTTILGYSRMLVEEVESESQRADLREIIHAGERAEDLTRRLLAFGHKRVAESVPLDLNDVVTDMDRLLRRTLGNDIELVTLLGEDLGFIEADEGQIAQVVMNLAVNARSAMPGGGKLVIRTARTNIDTAFCISRPGLSPGACVMLEVRDTGCGIRPELQERIFEPFFTTREKGEGTGLGLSIVYGIVRQCGGHIELQSEIDTGTCFRIYLPRAAGEPGAGDGVIAETAAPGGTETILLVEDEPAVRRLTSRWLTGLGYRVMDVRHGGDALRCFEQKKGEIDLVLTDVVMPHLGGPELVQELIRRKPALKVVFATGFMQQSSIIQGDRSFPVLLKPYTRESLAQGIREALDAALPPGDTLTGSSA